MTEKYTYKNRKNFRVHGIEPLGTKTFNHPIAGGYVELIKMTDKTNSKNKINEGDNK